MDGPFRAKAVTTCSSYSSILSYNLTRHLSWCSSCPCPVRAPAPGGVSLLGCSQGKRAQGAAAAWWWQEGSGGSSSAISSRAQPQPFPDPEMHQPGILHPLWWPFLALKPAEHRAWGVWWPSVCQGLRSGFSRGFVLESLTGSGWARSSQSFCIKSCLNPRLAVIYLLLGLPSLYPKTTRKE